MTNNIFLKSPKISYLIKFTVDQDFTQWKEENEMVIKNTEVLTFLLSSELYDIKTFHSSSNIAKFKGLGLFLFKANDGYILLAEPFYTTKLIDLQMIFQQTQSYNKNTSCKLNYINELTTLQINVDFENNKIEVFTNESKCFDYYLVDNLLEQHKVGFTFMGYSSSKSPIKVGLEEFSAIKLIRPDTMDKIFHSDARSFMSSVNKYDDKFGENASLSNIMLIEEKIERELESTKSLVELMMNRSKVIEKSIDSFQNIDSTNMYFRNEKFRNKMQTQVASLEELLGYNVKMGDGLKAVLTGFGSIEKLMNFKEKLNKVKEIVAVMDSFVKVEEFDKIINDLVEISENLKNESFNSYAANVISFASRLKNKMALSKTFQILVGVYSLIFLILVFLIMRKISEKIKNHIF